MDESAPSTLLRTTSALGIVALNVGGPLFGFLAVHFAVQMLGLGRDRTEQAYLALTNAVALGGAVYSLALAVLAPAKPQGRLIAIADGPANGMRRLFASLALVTGLDYLTTRMVDLLSSPISLVIAATSLFAVVEAGLIMAVLRIVSDTFDRTDDAEPLPPALEDRRPTSVIWRWLVPVGWLGSLGCIGAALLGYAALAHFVAQQMIWFGVVLALLFITLQVIDEGLTALFRVETPLGHALVRAMGFSRETVEQIGVILSALIRLVALAIGAYFVRPPWGDNSSDVLANARSAFFGIHIGNLTFSPATLLIGIAAFLVGVTITRSAQTWLDQRFLPRTRLDAGLKNSIRTAFGYSGYVLAAAVAFSSVGIGLENVALVAGALSVGIGFGLQSIVNNFVSGLILLAERPVRELHGVGDLIQREIARSGGPSPEAEPSAT